MAEKITTFNLNDFTPYILNSLSQRVSRNLAQVYQRQYGISIPEWRVMASLNNMRTATAKMLVQDSFMDKVKISRAIKKLREKKYIHTQSDSDDNRKIWLTLSHQGQALFEEIVPYAVQWEKQFLNSLQETEKHALVSTLNKLSKQLGE